MKTLPYYCFEKTSCGSKYEARFWNHGGKQLAIVACVTEGVDWAAYIGTDAPYSRTEVDTLRYVAEWGCKLSKEDANYFFPNIDLPYRN